MPGIELLLQQKEALQRFADLQAAEPRAAGLYTFTRVLDLEARTARLEAAKTGGPGGAQDAAEDQKAADPAGAKGADLADPRAAHLEPQALAAAARQVVGTGIRGLSVLQVRRAIEQEMGLAPGALDADRHAVKTAVQEALKDPTKQQDPAAPEAEGPATDGMKIPQLKASLKARQLPVGGKKEDLVKRLQEDDETENRQACLVTQGTTVMPVAKTLKLPGCKLGFQNERLVLKATAQSVAVNGQPLPKGQEVEVKQTDVVQCGLKKKYQEYAVYIEDAHRVHELLG